MTLIALLRFCQMEIGESSDGSNGGHLQAYLECYMSFSEAISAVLELSLTGEDFISVLPDVVGNLKDLILQIPTWVFRLPFLTFLIHPCPTT